MLLQQLNREYSQISCSIPEAVFKKRIKKKFCPFDPFSSMKKYLGMDKSTPTCCIVLFKNKNMDKFRLFNSLSHAKGATANQIEHVTFESGI